MSLNIVIELAGLALCALSILMLLIAPNATNYPKSAFLRYYACLLVLTGANLAGQFLDGRPGEAARMGLYASNFLEFLSSFLLLYIFSGQLFGATLPERTQKIAWGAIQFFALAYVAFLVISQFTGLYYVIDESNVYQRGAWYPLSFVCPAFIVLIDLWLVTCPENEMPRPGIMVCCFYGVVAVSAAILQLFVDSLAFVVYAGIVVALTMYIVIMDRQAQSYYRQEAENAKLKMDIMLNQIQPHFLYNTLTAIQDLCHSDPAQAEAAIVKFSRYLRGNMDSLRTERAIPFEQELKHTRIYLELEQMRFEDKLEVRYDIRCTDFELPTLTLQPIVENAVRHGVRGNAGGAGVVTVATRELPDRYEISVTDDGPGFRPDEPPKDAARAHIGIRNVRERLSRMRGGTLSIVSAPGHGTVVTFRLPKREPDRRERCYVNFRHR